jgi:hypothetical protein
MVADETPNKEATGLAHTPTHAPLLQHDNKIGAADVKPSVIVVQIVFLVFIFRYLELIITRLKLFFIIF